MNVSIRHMLLATALLGLPGTAWAGCCTSGGGSGGGGATAGGVNVGSPTGAMGGSMGGGGAGGGSSCCGAGAGGGLSGPTVAAPSGGAFNGVSAGASGMGGGASAGGSSMGGANPFFPLTSTCATRGCGGGASGGMGGGMGVGVGAGGGLSTNVTVSGPTIVTPNVTVGAPNVVVNHAGPTIATSIVVNGVSQTTGGHVGFNFGGQQGGFVIVGGGGGGGGFADGFAGGDVAGIVAGGAGPAQAAITQTSDSLAAIQAFCLDERGTPHPASQTFGEKAVPAAHRGEVFRCMAGTRMRVSIGAGNGDFNGARSFDCATGEALVYDGAQVACRTQEARRPCNERSLLRRFGPGIKLATLRTTTTSPAAPRVETAANSRSIASMPLDGGVGSGW